jgi:hypothetical protein
MEDPMTDRLYTTTTLLGLLPTLDKPNPWLRNTFFRTEILSPRTEIAFDKLSKRRKLAPFVSPRVPGKVRQPRGRMVTTFEPAYVKPKHEVNPDEAFIRVTGETLGGSLDADQRFDLAVLQNLEDEENEIARREEWMCSEILKTGKVVVAGDDYPAVTVDFARPSDQTVTLLTSARWGESGVSPLDDLRSWATIVANSSGGAVRQVILGASAAEILIKDTDVRAILDNRRQATGSMEMAPTVTGGQGFEAAYLGSIGTFDFWQYTNKYEDESGTTQDYWPEYGVGLIAPSALDGMMVYGAIRDKRAGLQPLKRFPKMWDQEDPSITWTMTQSAPLPVPSDVNGSFFATVR